MHELVHERLRAGITVRLKYDVDLAKTALPRSRQRRPDFRGMMAVIVDHAYTVNRPSQLETTIHSAEVFKSRSNLLDADVKANAHGNRGRSVQHVVYSRHMEAKLAQTFSLKSHFEMAAGLVFTWAERTFT